MKDKNLITLRNLIKRKAKLNLGFKIIILGLFLSFLNCTIPVDSEWYDCKVPNELKNLDPLRSFESQVSFWVYQKIEYKLYANGFHFAQKTLDERIGNCANRSLVKIALWYQITGQKGQLIYCWHDDGINKGLHYAAKINGYIAEEEYITEIYNVINFDDIAEYIYYRQ